MSDYRPDANRNQNQAGTPQESVYGTSLQSALARGLNDTLRTDTTAASYLFRGFIGRVPYATAKVIPVLGRSGGYQGELPLSEQPYVDRPRPWLMER